VLSFEGQPVGVVTLRELADARTAARLQDAARPLTPHLTVRPDEALTDVLRRPTTHKDGNALVVVDNHVLVGILTTADIRRTLELAQLNRKPVNAKSPF
jgi:CBS domain-containing protein